MHTCMSVLISAPRQLSRSKLLLGPVARPHLSLVYILALVVVALAVDEDGLW